MKKIFSFDAETNGLHGKAFAVAAVVRLEGGSIIEYIARCPIEDNVNDWVIENVLPQMEKVAITHDSYSEMLESFAKFYLENKNDANIIVHMGLPVEAKMLIDMHKMGFIGDWDMPYPLVDISAYHEIGTSVDTFNEKNGILIPSFEGGTHNPLYDSYAALYAYEKVIK